MKNELKSIAVKSVKLAGVTCVAAGAIALIASGTAVKAVTAGGKYLKETAKKILEEPVETKPVETAPVEEVTPVEEVAPVEEDAPVEGVAEELK